MNKQTEELKMMLSRFPLDDSEICEPFMNEKWHDILDNGFDTVEMDCSFDLTNNTETVKINISNSLQLQREWDSCNFAFNDIRIETIHEYTYPIFTTFNILMDCLNDYVESYKSGDGYTYSDICDMCDGDGAVDLIFASDNIRYIVDDICKQEAFTLEQYLRYTACITPHFKAFHSFDNLISFDKKNSISINVKEAVEEVVHKKSDEGFHNLIFISNLFDAIHNTLLLMAVNKQSIRKCSICGKYFIPANKSDEIYCRFPNDELKGKTCKDESKKLKQYQTEASKGEEFKLAKNIYNRLLNADKRRNYTSNKTEYTESLKFRELNSEKKAEVQQGTMTLEQYIQWLNDYDSATRKR